MKIYTNENNTCTLKLLIATNLAAKKVEIKKSSFGDSVFSGPRALPYLEVNDELAFFSSNAAVSYLIPSSDTPNEQLLEWEATRLYPAVHSVLQAKCVPADLKQLLNTLIKEIDVVLSKSQYVCGAKLSPADVSIWCTLYPIFGNNDLKTQYLNEAKNIVRWVDEIAGMKAVQESIKTWGGSTSGPFNTSSILGVPQVASLTSPVGSPDEASVELSVSPEEIELAKENWLNGIKNIAPRKAEEKVIVPVKGRKNILITSALPYVNNVPHLGNIIGCVLSADIFARYCRLCNYNTLYVSGTDEYGTATETKALEEGVTPRQICDKYFAIHNDVYRWFDIGFDHFGRTSTPEQTQITQKMFLKLQENGFITTQSVDQLFCPKCERFLADRFVEGTCHHPGCLYDSARGDQCDKCGKLINAVELIEPKCKVCGDKPVMKASEQLFLELGQLEPSLRSWANRSEAGWSAPARAVARAWLKEGLRPRAITRDLKWGVPVPAANFTKKVFYVWFDAPMGYMSITECATKQYEKWWKPDKEYDVKLYQFMAKDNVPFHAVMFPATLLGVNENHVLVSHLYATEYLNYEEGKFSKSRGVGVFGTDAQDTGIPSDVWRFYLASIRPETSDSSFSWIELGTRNNSELLNNLGNFCHRSLSFCWNSFGGRIPEVACTGVDLELIALINREMAAYVSDMEKGRLRDALRRVLSISKLGNQHMQSEQPWVLLKGSDDEKQRGASAIGLCCNIVTLLCALVAPYMPKASLQLAKYLGVDLKTITLNSENPRLVQYLPKGHQINKPEPLFTKIENERLEELKKKYAGTQSERQQNDAQKAAGSIQELEAAIAKQGEKVRQLKSSTKDKSVWQPEVNVLLELKKQLTEMQKNPVSNNVASAPANKSVQDLEAEIAKQGEKVRQLKSSTKDKAVWQPEVNVLLELKKQLTEMQKNPVPNNVASASSNKSVQDLEAEIAKQGEKVRQLKSSTKDKSVWQPEVNVLLELKKQLTEMQKNPPAPIESANKQSLQDLEAAIAKQGEKVRQLKSSTKDKSVWQPEVNVLLELKKQFAALQVK